MTPIGNDQLLIVGSCLQKVIQFRSAIFHLIIEVKVDSS